MTGEAKSLTIGGEGEEKTVELPDKCHSLRLRSIRKRIETERNRCLDKSSPAPTTTRSGKKRRSRRAAPLSRYRRKTANARERDRMRHVNDAFDKLKDSIPHHTLFQQVNESTSCCIRY